MSGFLLIALLMASSVGVSAQDVLPIKPGKRVRLKTHPDSSWVTGRLASVTGDTLVLSVYEGRSSTYASRPIYGEEIWISHAVSLNGITKLENYSFTRGTIKGTIFGFTTGFALMFLLLQNSDSDDIGYTPTMGLIGGGIVAPIGAFVGAMALGWKEIPLPLCAGISPHGGYVSLRFDFGR